MLLDGFVARRTERVLISLELFFVGKVKVISETAAFNELRHRSVTLRVGSLRINSSYSAQIDG